MLVRTGLGSSRTVSNALHGSRVEFGCLVLKWRFLSCGEFFVKETGHNLHLYRTLKSLVVGFFPSTDKNNVTVTVALEVSPVDKNNDGHFVKNVFPRT